jgi:3-dehydroquinate dehydratase-2
MAKCLLINGPNLNLLGTRQPEIYGAQTLSDIEQELSATAQLAGHELFCFQSNSEAALIDRIHLARTQDVKFILINPAAYTHTSVAIRDALLGVDIPFVEIHLSNIHARESFRHHSYLSDIAKGVICGLGVAGYGYGLSFAFSQLETSVTKAN